MCILIYYICSKCFCGYPRFTERCSSMHPPLIYCPRSTQFKFQIVEETECHLHPHHAPLLHLGANGEDTVLSVSPSGSGPVIEEVTHIPLEQDGLASKVADACTTLQIASPIKSPASYRASHIAKRDGAGDEQQNQKKCHCRTESTETTQTTDADGRPNGSSWNYGNFVPQTHSRSQRRAENSSNWRARENKNFKCNKATKGSAPWGNHQSSSFYGYYTNWGPPRAPYDFRYQARSYPQYQYYPYQAAPMPPFQAPSVTTPQGCTYMPVQSWGYHQHRGRPAVLGFHASSNQMAPEQTCGNDSGVSQPIQSHRDANRKHSFRPQACSFDPYVDEKSKSEIRRENLEQLRRSNEAAYYHCPYNGHDQSLFNADTTRETNPELGMPNAEDACDDTQRGNNPFSRPRSLSESCIQQESTSEISPPTTQEVHNFSEYEPNVDGKGKEHISSPFSAWVNVSPPNSSVQSASSTSLYGENHRIVKQANGDGVNDTKAGQQANVLWRQEVEGWPKLGQNFLEVNSVDNLEAEGQAIETDSVDFSKASVTAECDGSFNQESGNEYYKHRIITEWIPTSITNDARKKVNLCDISLPPEVLQTLNRVRPKDMESDVDIAGWHDSFEPPRAPPNSPIPSLSPSEVTYPHSSTFETDSQSIMKDDDIHGIDMQINSHSPFPIPDASLDKESLKAIRTANAPVASSIDFDHNASIKTHETSSSDVSNNIVSLHQQSKPNSVARAPKLWSEVVSGKHVPSESSDRFPAFVPPPTSSIQMTTPTNALGLIPESSAIDSPVTVPQTFPKRPNNASIVPPSIQPISPKTLAYPSPPPNSLTNPASMSVVPGHWPGTLNSVSERLFLSDSSLGSEDFAAVTKPTNSEPNEKAPSSVTQPAQSVDSTTPATPIQHVKPAPTLRTTPTVSAPTWAATDSRANLPPGAWSQLFQGSGRAKKFPASKPKSDNSIDEANWPSLGSRGPNNPRKWNTSS